MNQILKFSSSPLFANNFSQHDRKLHKNVIKRCLVEPIELMIKEPNINTIQSNIKLTECLLKLLRGLSEPEICTEALNIRLIDILKVVVEKFSQDKAFGHENELKNLRDIISKSVE